MACVHRRVKIRIHCVKAASRAEPFMSELSERNAKCASAVNYLVEERDRLMTLY